MMKPSPKTRARTQSRRLGSHALMAFCMASYVCMAWWSSVHLDLARDMRVALDIQSGLVAPLVGPVMAGQVHLGPAWYYLLALLASASGSWFGTVFLLALLGALQLPLAYLAGKEWKGKSAGWLWAVLLLLPSWSTFEQFNPTHTQLTAALLLGFVLCALRYYRRNRARYFIGAAFLFSLAIHAHPSTLAVSLVAVAMATIAARRKNPAPRRLFLAAAAVFALPFVPWFWNEIASGFASYTALGNYVGSENTRNISFLNVLPLAAQLGWGGLQYWTESILHLPAWQVFFASLVWALVAAAGLAGAVRAAFRHDKLTGFSLALVVFALFFIVAVRGYFPYYMTTVLRVLLCGIVAVGLSHVLKKGSAQVAVVAVALILSALIIFWCLRKWPNTKAKEIGLLPFCPCFMSHMKIHCTSPWP